MSDTRKAIALLVYEDTTVASFSWPVTVPVGEYDEAAVLADVIDAFEADQGDEIYWLRDGYLLFGVIAGDGWCSGDVGEQEILQVLKRRKEQGELLD